MFTLARQLRVASTGACGSHRLARSPAGPSPLSLALRRVPQPSAATMARHPNEGARCHLCCLSSLSHPVRSFHSSQHTLSQSSQPPPSSPRATASTTTTTTLPSIEPVLMELRSTVTRRYNLGEVFQALSPAARKLLVAHKLPLEELLLHLPQHFLLTRVRATKGGGNMTLCVSPPHLLLPGAVPLRLPSGTRPLPALVQLMGDAAAAKAVMAVSAPTPASTSSSPPFAGVGTGFVDPFSTPMDRIQEVLTYIPNEWAEFASLGISRDVQRRCMNFPTTRAYAFFLKHPKYFEVRSQALASHTFEVRRSLALQRQLAETPSRQR